MTEESSKKPSPSCSLTQKSSPGMLMLDWGTYTFDSIQFFWESKKTKRALATVLTLVFLSAALLIQANIWGFLPMKAARYIPTQHFAAVNLAFTLVLGIEVIDLIFVIPSSFSRSMGKQFEILSLILLRGAFKELGHLTAPVGGTTNFDVIYHMAADCFGALAIFAILGIYYRLQGGRVEILEGEARYCFIAKKKILALALALAFLGMGALNLGLWASGREQFPFFAEFYELLIFADILIVLISQRYVPSYAAVFRNSGFAAATLFIRFALSAPVYVNAALGVAAALFALAMSYTHKRFFAFKLDKRRG